MSAEHVGGTRGSGIVSSAADVRWMSVVGGMRGVGGVCENVCLSLVCGCVGGVDGEWVGGLARVWRGGVVLCLCESGFSE